MCNMEGCCSFQEREEVDAVPQGDDFKGEKASPMLEWDASYL
jgi:hypothetical protein